MKSRLRSQGGTAASPSGLVACARVRPPAPQSRRVAAAGAARSTSRQSFLAGPAPRIVPCVDNVSLPPELERFAADAIATGRYRDRADLVAAGVGLLQRQEVLRAELLGSVLSAKGEGDRDGYLTADEVALRVHATIARRSSGAA